MRNEIKAEIMAGRESADAQRRVLVYDGQLPERNRHEEIHGLLYLYLLTAPALATDTILDLWRWTLQVGVPATAPRSGVLPPHVRIPVGKNVAREVLTNLGARTRTQRPTPRLAAGTCSCSYGR